MPDTEAELVEQDTAAGRSVCYMALEALAQDMAGSWGLLRDIAAGP